MKSPSNRDAALAVAALVLAAAGPAAAQAPEKQTLSVTNGAGQMVFCTLLVDGKALKELAIRSGKTYAEAFDPRRLHQLVCNRATENAFRVTPGAAYRFETAGRKVALVPTSGE